MSETLATEILPHLKFVANLFAYYICTVVALFCLLLMSICFLVMRMQGKVLNSSLYSRALPGLGAVLLRHVFRLHTLLG